MNPVTRDDLVKAVHNLNASTRDGRLQWHICQPQTGPVLTIGTLLAERRAYCAPYEGKTLRLTEIPGTSGILTLDQTRNYLLEILEGEGGKVLYQFPNVQGIADLCLTIQFSIGGVEDIIRSLAGKG